MAKGWQKISQVPFGPYCLLLYARCLQVYILILYLGTGLLSLFPQFFSAFLLSHSLSISLSPLLCLYMLVSAGLSRPVNLSAISEDSALCFSCSLLPFPVIFSPLLLSVMCSRHTNALSLTHSTFAQKGRQTHSLTLRLKYILPLSRSLALS